jgi:hypothetical protein
VTSRLKKLLALTSRVEETLSCDKPVNVNTGPNVTSSRKFYPSRMGLATKLLNHRHIKLKTVTPAVPKHDPLIRMIIANLKKFVFSPDEITIESKEWKAKRLQSKGAENEG